MVDRMFMDIFRLPDDLSTWKLSLSIHPTEDRDSRFIDDLLENGISGVDHSFAFNAWQGKRRNFKVGEKVLCFVKLPQRNCWMFHMAGEVLEVPTIEEQGACKFKVLTEYQPMFGRLVVEFDKGNTYSRYAFKLDNFLKEHSELKVKELWSSELEPFVKFEGFNKTLWTFSKLQQVLESPRFASTKEKLAEMKGVYLLTDTTNGKLYVGSAYGKDGFAQRWQCYLDTQTGGNKGLKELVDKLGNEYFKKNFNFSFLEWFDHKTSDREILEAEALWKEKLQSRKFGYNWN